MPKYSQFSNTTKVAEVLNLEDKSEDKRFVALAEGIMEGFDGRAYDNPYVLAFQYPLYSWFEKGYDIGAAYAASSKR